MKSPYHAHMRAYVRQVRENFRRPKKAGIPKIKRALKAVTEIGTEFNFASVSTALLTPWKSKIQEAIAIGFGRLIFVFICTGVVGTVLTGLEHRRNAGGLSRVAIPIVHRLDP